MTPWSLHLLIVGAGCVAAGLVALAALLSRAASQRALRRERGRRRAAERQVVTLRARLECHRRLRHLPGPVVLPGLGHIDRVEEQTVLMRAMTPAAIAHHEQLRGRP